MFWLVLTGLMAVAIVSFYLYVTWKNNYWSKRGLPFLKPTFILGSVHDYLAMTFLGGCGLVNFTEKIDKVTNSKGLCGFFQFRDPSLYVSNPEIIRKITIKDFDYFVNPRSFGAKDGMMDLMLFNRKDKDWKDLRSVMTPAFTSSKMRDMSPVIEEIAIRLRDHLVKKSNKPDGADLSQCSGLFTMDVISAVGFGLESNSFNDESSLFLKHAKGFIQPEGLSLLKAFFEFTFPKIANTFGIKSYVESNAFFKKVIKQVIEDRKNNTEGRNDFVRLLLESAGLINNNDDKAIQKNVEKNITTADIVSQSVMFLPVGYETIATTTTFTLWLLTIHPLIQKKAREEVLKVLEETDGVASHDAVNKMHFLEACINESLRLYPLIPFTERECSKDYRLEEANITIPKDMIITIAIHPIHRNEKFWPEPNQYNPDRFMPENKGNIKPYTFIPFGAGPRMCIGMRLAMLEMKTAIAVLLRDVEFSPSPSTYLSAHDIPLDNAAFVTKPKDPIRVSCRLR